MRRQIVEHLARAHREVAAVTFVEECDFSEVDLKRIVPLTLAAVAAALKEYPELNAGSRMTRSSTSSATTSASPSRRTRPRRPVVQGCDTAPAQELAAEVERLAEAARPARSRPKSYAAAPHGDERRRARRRLRDTVVNHPEVAILGIHRIGPRPVVRDDEIAVRQIGNVSVTFDHRVVDDAGGCVRTRRDPPARGIKPIRLRTRRADTPGGPYPSEKGGSARSG